MLVFELPPMPDEVVPEKYAEPSSAAITPSMSMSELVLSTLAVARAPDRDITVTVEQPRAPTAPKQ